MKKYGVMVILFYPDERAFMHINQYKARFDHVYIYDNTPSNAINYSIQNDINVVYVRNGINNGISIALEEGIKWAKANNIDYLLTMDQDSEFPIEEINKIINFIENENEPRGAIYCPNYRKIYIDNKTKQLQFSSSKISKKDVVQVCQCMTSGSFMNVGMVSNALPLDNLFIGLVDNDLCYMLKTMGYKIIMIGSSMLSQRVGESTYANLVNRIFHVSILSSKRYYYMARNLVYLKDKYKNNDEIIKEINIIKIRIVFNLYLFEKDKIEKIKYWKLGLRTKCPPFENI